MSVLVRVCGRGGGGGGALARTRACTIYHPHLKSSYWAHGALAIIIIIIVVIAGRLSVELSACSGVARGRSAGQLGWCK